MSPTLSAREIVIITNMMKFYGEQASTQVFDFFSLSGSENRNQYYNLTNSNSRYVTPSQLTATEINNLLSLDAKVITNIDGASHLADAMAINMYGRHATTSEIATMQKTIDNPKAFVSKLKATSKTDTAVYVDKLEAAKMATIWGAQIDLNKINPSNILDMKVSERAYIDSLMNDTHGRDATAKEFATLQKLLVAGKDIEPALLKIKGTMGTPDYQKAKDAAAAVLEEQFNNSPVGLTMDKITPPHNLSVESSVNPDTGGWVSVHQTYEFDGLNNIVLKGIADAGDTIHVLVDSSYDGVAGTYIEVGTGTVASDGTFSVALTLDANIFGNLNANTLHDSAFMLTAYAVNEAGERSVQMDGTKIQKYVSLDNMNTTYESPYLHGFDIAKGETDTFSMVNIQIDTTGPELLQFVSSRLNHYQEMIYLNFADNMDHIESFMINGEPIDSLYAGQYDASKGHTGQTFTYQFQAETPDAMPSTGDVITFVGVDQAGHSAEYTQLLSVLNLWS